MTSADTIGCRLALAREEDGNRETGDRRQETGDRRQETGDRRQETGDRRLVSGLVINCKLLIHPKAGFSPFSHSDTLVLPYWTKSEELIRRIRLILAVPPPIGRRRSRVDRGD